MSKPSVHEDKERRLGWVLAELGKEDVVIADLKKKLTRHEGRRRELERASQRLIKEVELK